MYNEQRTPVLMNMVLNEFLNISNEFLGPFIFDDKTSDKKHRFNKHCF